METKKILGLDLGVNSIGWSLIELIENQDESESKGKVLGSGVIVPKASADEGGNLLRRQKRSIRRQFFRTRCRKLDLIKLLVDKSMFPAVENAERVARLQALRLDADLREFFSIDPYAQRQRAAEGEKLTLLQLGRVFYHLAQRRGYKENRLAGSGDEEGVLFEGNPAEGKIGISATRKAMGDQTLGQYLASLEPHQVRLRNRYTLRSMYLEEFAVIWAKQRPHYPALLTDELKTTLGDPKTGLLFSQRPLKSQKSLVGKCTFEYDEKKTKGPNGELITQKYYLPTCPKSSPAFEKFRMYQFINTIAVGIHRLMDLPAADEYRRKLVELFNAKTRTSKFEFKEIKKRLGMAAETFNYPDERKVVGNHTIASLRNLFNYSEKELTQGFDEAQKKVWKKLPQPEVDRQLNRWEHLAPEEQEKRWHVFQTFDNTDRIKAHALKHNWGLAEERLAQLGKVRLEQGYGSLSRRAIDNILPFLEQGYLYHEAVMLGGINRAFKTDWAELAPEEKQKLLNQVVELMRRPRAKGETMFEDIKAYLRQHYARTEVDLARLYHHSDLQGPTGEADELGIPPKLRNPVVQKVLGSLRRLVNQISQQYGKPDRIVVEMAREMNQTQEDREKDDRRMRQNAQINDEVKRRLAAAGLPPSVENIQKYLLWEECRRTCPYTGMSIGFEDLFLQGLFQVEHIVPRSISLDNSMGNKTLCQADLNREKSNRTPYQLYKNEPERWEQVKTRLLGLIKGRSGDDGADKEKATAKIPDIFPYNKFKRFVSEADPKPDEFQSRQLNDTRYLAREAKAYLGQICADVVVAQGGATALLKHYWGLDNLPGLLSSVVYLNAQQIAEWSIQNAKEYYLAVDLEGEPLAARPWSQDYKENKKSQEELQKIGRVAFGLADLHPSGQSGKVLVGKNRTDHRHHALDALVLACTQLRHLQKIATLLGQGTKFADLKKDKKLFPLPWPNFRGDVKATLTDLLVVHPGPKPPLTQNQKWVNVRVKGQKMERKLASGLAVRGPLHEESYFGRYVDKTTKAEEYRKRKPLASLETMKQVNKIVDEGVRAQVLARLKEAGVDIENPKTDFSKLRFNQ
jgi:CRISPR-associated endonuclease Csn1